LLNFVKRIASAAVGVTRDGKLARGAIHECRHQENYHGGDRCNWRRGTEGVAVGETLKPNASKVEQTERAEPPLGSIVQSAQELNRSRSRAPKTDSDFERLLTPKETAQFLRVSESWLAKARMRGDGPPYLLFGRSIRYGGDGLVRWMKSCVRQSTSER
jgi:hypothetical protein